jgi:ankyrin repeat protein
MGCGQSKTIVPGQSELVDEQPGKVKHQLAIAIKRDDPVLFESVMENYNVSLQEKLNDGFDTNWTVFHFAASKNSAKVIENFLETRLSHSQLSFDIVNARDLAGKTPLEIAYDYSSFEVFETLLRTCSKHQQKVSMKSELINCLDKDSEYMQAIIEYKSQSPASSEPNSRTNLVKQDGEYLVILNKGQVAEAINEKVKDLKPSSSFKDKEFCNNGINGDESKLDKAAKTTWVQAKDFLKQDYCIYNKGRFNLNIEISSINPNLNNLFGAFSEYPNCLNRIFTSLKTNQQGYVGMILYYSGQPDLMLLDEYFPCNKSKDSFLYQKPFGNEITRKSQI